MRALQRALGGSDGDTNTLNGQKGIVNSSGNGSAGSGVRTGDLQRPQPPRFSSPPLRLDTAGVARLLCATAAPAALPLTVNERDECLVALLFLLYIRCVGSIFGQYRCSSKAGHWFLVL